MKKILALSLLALSSVVMAGDGDGSDAPKNKYYVMIDTGMERDTNSLANDYINANITMGVKTPSKTEYSVKVGASLKDMPSSTDKLSNNIELKIKQSFDVGAFFTPYVAFRLGEKFKETTVHFPHYAFDAGIKVPLTESFAVDVGARYRNAFDSSKEYRSTRLHVMGLYDFDKHNTVGLRYTQSEAQNPDEERHGWRVHYQRNY